VKNYLPKETSAKDSNEEYEGHTTQTHNNPLLLFSLFGENNHKFAATFEFKYCDVERWL